MPIETTDLADVMVPDFITPMQWKASLEVYEKSPDHRLMYAVFEDGIRCYLEYRNAVSLKNKKLHEEAERWIFGDSLSFVSFEQCCDVLGYDVEATRQRLRVKIIEPGSGKIHSRRPGRSSRVMA